MRVLGIDPGSRITGYGVVERVGSSFKVISYGALKLGSGPMDGRLKLLFQALMQTVADHDPTCLAIEGIFHAKNAGSALKLGHARGVAILVAALNDLAVNEYAPTVVKRSVTSSGRAPKEQVQRMVTMILGLKQTPSPDAADALAVAICHAQTSRTNLR